MVQISFRLTSSGRISTLQFHHKMWRGASSPDCSHLTPSLCPLRCFHISHTILLEHKHAHLKLNGTNIYLYIYMCIYMQCGCSAKCLKTRGFPTADSGNIFSPHFKFWTMRCRVLFFSTHHKRLSPEETLMVLMQQQSPWLSLLPSLCVYVCTTEWMECTFVQMCAHSMGLQVFACV